MGLFEGTKWDVPVKCDRCGQLEAECSCPPPEPVAPEPIAAGKQKLRLRVEKRKRGKEVTLISGLRFTATEQAKSLLKKLKDHCGAGGSISEEPEQTNLEIQGNQIKKLEPFLKQLGYPVKVV